MLQNDQPQDMPCDETFPVFGAFEPFEARRLLKHFEDEAIRFRIEAREWLALSRPWARLRRYSAIRIFVHLEDQAKAQSIFREDHPI